MKCQNCSNQATVHLTDIINKKKREVHLCESCARKQNLIPNQQPEMSIPALLQYLVAQSAAHLLTHDPDQSACPHCGMKYTQFRAKGRLGCPKDYEVFSSALEPLLDRIHRRIRHVGKVPASIRRRSVLVQKEELQSRLHKAVAEERYEDAARLRDQLRSLGGTDEPR